jgi:hypothetical protein
VTFAPSLPVALDGLYAAFDPVPAPRTLTHCGAHPMTDRELGDLLNAGPVRAIPAQTLEPYASNCSFLWPATPPADDLRYFAPRIVEIVVGDRRFWPDLESLGRVLGGMAPAWTQPERDGIRQVLRALWQHQLGTDPAMDPHLPELDEILRAAGHFSGDIAPYLREWTASLDQRWPASHLADLLLVDALPGWARQLVEMGAAQLNTWLHGPDLRDAARRASAATPDDEDATTLAAYLVWPFEVDT